MGVIVINVDAGRLREPAAWLMVAAACFGTLSDVRQLLFGDAFGASFAGRAALYLPQLVSPVIWALLVGAVLLASNFGPPIARLKILVYVAAGTLAVSVVFGFIGLLGGLFSGSSGFLEKIEFLLEGLPLLALSALALLYLLPKAVPSGPRATEFHPQSFRPDGGFGGGHPQQPPSSPIPSYAPGAASQAPPAPGQAPFVPGQAPFAPAHDQAPFAPAHDQAPQAPYGAQAPQEPSAPAPSAPYSPPALPPAPADAYASQASPAQAPYGTPADDRSYGAPAGYGQAPAQSYAEQQAQSYAEQSYAEQSYASPAEPQAPVYGAPAEQSYAAPAEQQPAQHAEPQTYTPSPYVAADVQPSAPARPYEPPLSSYEPPAHAYAAPAEQQAPPVQPVQSQGYVPSSTEPQLSSYGQAEPQQAGYGQQGSAQPYTPSPTEPQLSSYGQAEPQQQSYTPADSHPGLPFDGQAQASFPAPPENYGQPLTGYSGAEFARQAEQGPHYPDPVDARSQQIAQAYQQAESYQQTQGGGTEPQLRVPEYGAPGYDDPFGHPQASQSAPQWETPQASQSAPQWETPQSSQSAPQWETPQMSQSAPQWETPQSSQSAPQWETPQASQSAPQWETPQASQSAPRWEPPAADATLRFDPAAYQNDPLNAPGPVGHAAAPQSWDSQPPIDPTAIYTPERPGQVTSGENSDRERVGPGQEQNTSWYGSDRREH
ncbi:sulfite exporter TauE/SafE family protein [Planobispora takensis]|uniref:Uncharacterized protein n=1 Tax=Planobispora takensis TaxID=1367882 RepID=A0A8J3SUU0_9ACTN|nr:sulfite exporter TauE/SafE family protein [Planobispora takensis]GII00902.1 hypothetical protein Pta02_29100 [Planobispora takensis]